jgi:hypothetical protein
VGFAVMVGLWVVYGGLWWICGGGIAGFAVMMGLWVVYGGFAVVCGGGIAVSNFFFFFILHCSKHCKIFFILFSKMQTNTEKTNIFL